MTNDPGSYRINHYYTVVLRSDPFDMGEPLVWYTMWCHVVLNEIVSWHDELFRLSKWLYFENHWHQNLQISLFLSVYLTKPINTRNQTQFESYNIPVTDGQHLSILIAMISSHNRVVVLNFWKRPTCFVVFTYGIINLKIFTIAILHILWSQNPWACLTIFVHHTASNSTHMNAHWKGDDIYGILAYNFVWFLIWNPNTSTRTRSWIIRIICIIWEFLFE